MRIVKRFVTGLVGLFASLTASVSAQDQLFEDELQTLPGPFTEMEGTVPYDVFPFPDVPRGEIWIPEMRYEPLSTFVPDSFLSELPASARTIFDEGRRLRDAGQGQTAIDYLTANIDGLPEGFAESEISSIYSNGYGGIPVDRAEAILWAERAAEKRPNYYVWLAQLAETQEMRWHYWSKGLSRGCHGCAWPLYHAQVYAEKKGRFSVDKMLRTGNGDTSANEFRDVLSWDERIKVAAFAVEIGDPSGHRLLADAAVMGRGYDGFDFKDIDDASPFGADIRQTARQLTGQNITSVALPYVVTQRVRSGLIPDSFRKAEERMMQGKTVEAVSLLLNHEAHGRYAPAIINAVMGRTTREHDISPSVANSFVLWSLESGGLSDFDSAALIYKFGLKIRVKNSDGWGTTTKKDERVADTILAFGSTMDVISPTTLSYIAQLENRIGAGQLAKSAESCLASAYSQSSLFEQFSVWKTCLATVYAAWGVTDEVDFYPEPSGLIEQFQRLEDSLAVEEKNRRRQAVYDGIQARRENADPRYYSQPTFGSNLELMAAIDRQYDWDMDMASRSSAAQLKPGEFNTVAAYKARRYEQQQRVMRGQVQDYREMDLTRPDDAVCARWSMVNMPHCAAPTQ
ncbi:hypothetical protein FF098_004955 [Parvularcula flava]|uniref:Uncharacterized protein n=1 Tax=Aquisalinus luteolus TaxID=1566827 RepID=A0A8J3A2V8_9PROT|nr:hypothetical protein [Aquisalinus luteolus]NHK27245.1 hypothetical protein [Aquisalinus luteolus]GGH94852.1 hypothetical protein GCM10011355_10010 [Aquisalinus luteolus]